MRRQLTWTMLPVALAAFASGCTATAGAPAACLTYANDVYGTVAATFPSTVAAIRRLPAVADNPQLAGYAEGEEATVCYIDGQVPKGPPPVEGTPRPPFDRAVLVAVGDETYVVSAGYSESLPIQAP
jgi:hypothetical protein